LNRAFCMDTLTVDCREPRGPAPPPRPRCWRGRGLRTAVAGCTVGFWERVDLSDGQERALDVCLSSPLRSCTQYETVSCAGLGTRCTFNCSGVRYQWTSFVQNGGRRP
jgi:hypothetical protein